ncbi:nicotinate-nicotinamide nucleotide adenylyltransferase [Marinicella sediminis]|uniref:Probable nicotinate-nucleotide adenylyltransferase n=1 Tax=Marinicella sediminis TaxID=1792834 RepID=A0ABV7J992_9GAMM|nr:nicotinate-nicotinamide nucleotide adenylyltransferase [Marinicella sediminis]
MNPQSQYTLIFGLTADPPHAGHEQVVINSYQWAKDHGLGIERFVLVPTYQPNLIAGKQQPGTAFTHRLTMCQLLAEHISNEHQFRAEVSDVEKHLFKETGTKSFSVDTLRRVAAKRRLFVLSADHFGGRWPKFRKWHQWHNLVRENGLLIHQRPGHSINNSFIKQLQEINSSVFVVSGKPAVNVSSTHLRQILSRGKLPAASLINPGVLDYVITHALYQRR